VPAVNEIPIALQTFSVRHVWAQKPADVLKVVADAGYDAVELYGADYQRDPAEMRRLLDDHGLRCAGAHTPLSRLQGDQFQATVDFAATVGFNYLIVPGLGEQYTKTLDGWRKAADEISFASERLADFDCRTGYHNHWIEFTPLADEASDALPWDVFFSRADASVIMQFDTGNVLRGSADVDPAEYIKRYPGRAQSVHLKDYSRATGADAIIGQGDVDFASLLPLCAAAGDTRWFVIEHENEKVDALGAVVDCMKGLQALTR
jgi:sugar phosphate isomerase/epimerase